MPAPDHIAMSKQPNTSAALVGEMPPRRCTRTPTLPSGLTLRQEAFAQNVAAGANHTSAYLASYGAGCKKKTTIYRRAHEIAHLGKVQARIAELRSETSQNSQEMRMYALFQLQHEMMTARSSSARIAAARLLLRACGQPKPDQSKVVGDQKSLRDELEARLHALLPPRSDDGGQTTEDGRQKNRG
jgi:hypothetical protein